MSRDLDTLLRAAADDVHAWADAQPVPTLEQIPSDPVRTRRAGGPPRRSLLAAAAVVTVVAAVGGAVTWLRADRPTRVVVPGRTNGTGPTTVLPLPPPVAGTFADGTPWRLEVPVPGVLDVTADGRSLPVEIPSESATDPLLSGSPNGFGRVVDVRLHGSRFVVLALPVAFAHRFDAYRALGPDGVLPSSVGIQLVTPAALLPDDVPGSEDRPVVALAVDDDLPWTAVEYTIGADRPGGNRVELPAAVAPTSEGAELAGGFRVVVADGVVKGFLGGPTGDSSVSVPVDEARRTVEGLSYVSTTGDPTRWVIGIMAGRDLGAVSVRIDGLPDDSRPVVPLAELRPGWPVLGASYETARVADGRLELVALDASGAEVGRTSASI